MKVIIRETKREASIWAARHIVAAIKAIDTYDELIRMYRNGEVSFKNVVTFNMDEYVGLPVEHPESYHSFMFKYLFDHIDINPKNIHILDGNAPDLAAECENYEKAIEKAGGIDLFLGGVGEDGHLAFNEPFSSLNSRTRVMTLTYDTRVVNSRFFDNDVNQVPHQAMSVGIATVMGAKEVLVEGFGAKKARAIAAAVEGPVSQYVTLSALQYHPNGIVLIDDEAAGELKVNSYRYFKAVEQAG